MSRTVAKTLAISALTLSLGVLAAPAAVAETVVPATPVMGSASLCFSIPVGSAALVWCL